MQYTRIGSMVVLVLVMAGVTLWAADMLIVNISPPDAVATMPGDTAQQGLCTARDTAIIEAIKAQQAQIRALQDELAKLKRYDVKTKGYLIAS